MDEYLSWDEKIIDDFGDANTSAMYGDGFVFTRIKRGAMTQTRSVRIDLKKFELSSENRRVLRKTENIEMRITRLPHPDYDWRIAKMGFDFYTKKFGKKTFSANKIKELLTSEQSNYNLLMKFIDHDSKESVGYAICFDNKDLLHYAYPFYNLNSSISNLGMGMMTKAIVWAKEQDKKFVYLGSAKNSTAIYKTQFSGFEWFDGKEWQTNIEELKKIL
jgi:arginyl-tRNA--protein-N-Asp/Glu arginylyltransferase